MGVRWHGKGAYGRGIVTTETVKAKSLYRAREGDFTFNRIDTQNGAFDVVPAELDGALATNEFPLYEVDEEEAEARFLLLNFRRPEVLHQISTLRAGSEGRARWKEADFEAWIVPVPPLSVQRRIIELIDAVDDHIAALDAEADALDALLRGRKEELFARYAATGTPLPIGEVLEEVKRPITVNPVAEYRQIGIRSHGRGLFTKEAVTGESLGSKKVFWVEPGDLVINIVFAWEGAVAIVPPHIKGYCGSHRFPTYRRLDGGDAEFFRLFFSSKVGTRLLAICSPGGAGRNRTLNRKRLMQSPVGIPSASEQKRAICELQALEAPVMAVRAEANRLRAVRATLLSGLLDRTIEIESAELGV
ncbi:hypothetical protein ACN265_25055 [Micromonospora sp. WMMD730]|uniref:hypothetical protein n=1 Tax=Micromonospora sp. WMMD730 TaxID=3404128 RepID=UPI003B955F5C